MDTCAHHVGPREYGPFPAIEHRQLCHPSFFTSSGESSMVERQEFYRKMNVAVRVHDDDLELEIANPAISHSADPS